MARAESSRIWPMRFALLALVLAVIFFQLLPLSSFQQPLTETTPEASSEAFLPGSEALNQTEFVTVSAEFTRLAGPDLLIVLLCVWALRRPEFVPMLLVAGIILLADMLFLRPPGLWAAIAVVLVEWLKSQEKRLREAAFISEWLTFAFGLLAATLLYRVILSFTVVEPGSLTVAISQYVATLIAYPLIVGLSVWVFNVRRLGPGEQSVKGPRI